MAPSRARATPERFAPAADPYAMAVWSLRRSFLRPPARVARRGSRAVTLRRDVTGRVSCLRFRMGRRRGVGLTDEGEMRHLRPRPKCRLAAILDGAVDSPRSPYRISLSSWRQLLARCSITPGVIGQCECAVEPYRP